MQQKKQLNKFHIISYKSLELLSCLPNMKEKLQAGQWLPAISCLPVSKGLLPAY